MGRVIGLRGRFLWWVLQFSSSPPSPFSKINFQVFCELADGENFGEKQIVYVIIAIASWYYPNPDVATSNGIEGMAVSPNNITIDKALLKDLLTMANQNA